MQPFAEIRHRERHRAAIDAVDEHLRLRLVRLDVQRATAVSDDGPIV
jgi:hypothetical protein